MPSKRFNETFAKLAAAEEQFQSREFLAPVMDSGVVQVRIAGVINRLSIKPRNFTGFGVFQPTSPSEAVLVRNATLAQRRQYLELFPLVRLIL